MPTAAEIKAANARNKKTQAAAADAGVDGAETTTKKRAGRKPALRNEAGERVDEAGNVLPKKKIVRKSPEERRTILETAIVAETERHTERMKVLTAKLHAVNNAPSTAIPREAAVHQLAQIKSQVPAGVSMADYLKGEKARLAKLQKMAADVTDEELDAVDLDADDEDESEDDSAEEDDTDETSDEE